MRSESENGSAISSTANGGRASVAPLTTPPAPTCSVYQPAVRTRAARDPAGPSASSPPSMPQSARTAYTDSGRTSGSSPVTAASGSAKPNAANWWGSEEKASLLGANAPTITMPTRKYGMSSAPPRIRCTQRRRARAPRSRLTRPGGR